MSDSAHLERWQAAKEAFKVQTGREIDGYALVMIDTQGEIHWGANFTGNKQVLSEMLNKLNYIRNDLKKFLKEVSA